MLKQGEISFDTLITRRRGWVLWILMISQLDQRLDQLEKEAYILSYYRKVDEYASFLK